MKITVKMRSGQETKFSTEKKSVTVGRSNKSDMVIPDDSLSRQHALIEFENGEFFITDLGSVNGVFVNGEKIDAQTKTPFSSFFQVSLGALECLIEDNTGQDITMRTNSNLLNSENDNYHAMTKHLDMKELKKATPGPKASSAPVETKQQAIKNKPFVKRKDNQNKFVKPLTIISICILLFAYFQTKEKPQTIESKKTEDPRPFKQDLLEKLKMIPNEFLANEVYANNIQNKNCNEPTNSRTCSDFELNGALNEGVVQIKQDLIIYLNPSPHLTKDTFAKILDKEEKDYLLAIYLVLKSNMGYQMVDSKTGQIHVVIKNEDSSTHKVIRFHPAHISTQDLRVQVLIELAQAIKDGQTDTFWFKNKPHFPLLTF